MSGFRFETSQHGIQSNGRPTVTLDLRELTFIDSSGIRAILRADTRARALGSRLRLIAGPERVQKVFQITRLDHQLEFVDPEE